MLPYVFFVCKQLYIYIYFVKIRSKLVSNVFLFLIFKQLCLVCEFVDIHIYDVTLEARVFKEVLLYFEVPTTKTI